MRRLSRDRLFIYISTLYLVGLVFGIIMLARVRLTLNPGEKFIKVFTANYWYLFLMWIFGFSILGLFFNTMIIFFRGFLFGACLSLLFFSSFKYLVFLTVLEFLLFIPVFFTLAYFSLTFSRYSSTSSFNLNRRYYLGVFLIVTIIIIIYSVIIVLYKV